LQTQVRWPRSFDQYGTLPLPHTKLQASTIVCAASGVKLTTEQETVLGGSVWLIIKDRT
jgi:hypothetical protein